MNLVMDAGGQLPNANNFLIATTLKRREKESSSIECL
jgi:hypothetical protein